MSRTGMNSDQARRRVRIAQFAVLGLGVAAAALWALDVPGLTGALPAKPVFTAAGQPEAPPRDVRLVSISSDAPLGIAERLDIAANRPAAPSETPTATVPETPRVESGELSPWKYLGPIFESTRTLALVSLEGRQRIVSEGSKVTIRTPSAEGRPESIAYQATVKKVDPAFIEVEEDGGRLLRVELETRTARVAWVKNMPTTVAGSAVNGGGVLTAEARARLAASGIDPQQIERARQAALAGRSRATPGGEAGAMPQAGAARVVDVVRGRASDPNAVGTRASTGRDADAVADDRATHKTRLDESGVIN